MDQMAVDIEQAGAVIGFVDQMVIPDFVVQRVGLGMSVKLQEFEVVRRESRAAKRNVGAAQSARVSSEVADVANRPKKRPGRRERSSITTRRRTMLV